MKYNIRTVSTANPRKCGIGVYDGNLKKNMKTFTSEVGAVDTAAIDNQGLLYRSNSSVDLIINQNYLPSWIKNARAVGIRAEEKSSNGKQDTIVLVNHELGLGGTDWQKDDNYSPFLDKLRKTPAYQKGLLHIISCLHTILAEPNDFHKKVIRNIVEKSDGTIVLANCGKPILTSLYDIDAAKNLIKHLEHGTRMVEYNDEDRKNVKKSWGEDEDTYFIVSPGLIGDSKGLFKYGVPGYARAVKLLEKINPNIKTRYLILGQCPPDFEDKTKYFNIFKRASLESLAKTGLLLNKNPFSRKNKVNELGKRQWKDNKHGIFLAYNFLTEEEYSDAFGGADLLCFPYLNKQQISSGQVSEAIGHGRDSICTKFWHASEMLSDDVKFDTLADLLNPNLMPEEGHIIGKDSPDARGLLVDCDNGEQTINQIGRATVRAIIDENSHILRSENAHEKGHEMTWKNIAWRHLHFGDFIRKRKNRMGL